MKPFSQKLRRALRSIFALTIMCVLGLTLPARAETIIVESKLPDGADNPAWKTVSGKWGRSKNKSKQSEVTLNATNVASCVTASPAPSFTISPELKAGATYTLDVTFGTSKTQPASSDLVVSVKAEGVSESSMPETTTAFQDANANTWTTVGKFKADTGKPSITFTYVSGALGTNPPARWYADAVRFVPASGGAQPKTKPAE